MRFEERRGGESYRPNNVRYSRSRSRSRVRRPRSPPRNRSPRLGADTWAPRSNHPSERYRSRSPAGYHRSRSPSYRQSQRARSPLRLRSPRRDRLRSPARSSWRSRSPFSHRPPIEHESSRGVGDTFRSSQIPRSPRRERQLSPPRDRLRDAQSPSRPTYKERGSYGRPAGRSRSPYRRERSPRNDSFQNRQTLSPVKRIPSGHTSAFNSTSTSRRSSPPTAHERLRVPSTGPRSRSPTLDTPSRRAVKDDVAKVINAHQSTPAHGKSVNNSQANEDRPSAENTDRRTTDRDDGLKEPRSGTSRSSQDGTLPTAPVASNLPPSIASQNQPSNISLLSAPTRPRGAAGYNSRDPSWSGSSTPRRAPPTTPHGPPTGPRNRYVYNPPVHELHRAPSSYRHNNAAPVGHQRSTRTNHLANLPTTVSGGRLLPLAFDFAIEKRLLNLKVDEEKLMEQMLEKQHLKRVGLQDWDRLQRESALNSLRSELAEGHLQRMTEEDRLEGNNAF